MKTVLITGAEGNIGSRLRESLADAYDLRSLTWQPVVGLASHGADVADLEAITPAFVGVETVVHLAASAPMDTPWPDVLHNNIEGTYAVFEAARRAGVKQVVFASSNHAVGMFEVEHAPDLYRRRSGVMVDEQAPPRPDTYYGVSKVFGEALGRYYSEQHGLSVYCLRIGNARRDDDPHSPAVLDGPNPPTLPNLTRNQRIRRYAATWISHADLGRLVDACLRAEHVRFGVYYGVSDNPYRFWSLDSAWKDLGWWPQDRPPALSPDEEDD